MITLPEGFRYADECDRAILPEFVILASHGVALDIWADEAPEGMNPRSYGEDMHAARASRGEIVVYDTGDGPLACLTSYAITEEEMPGPNESPSFLPVIELENMAVPSWNILVLATLPAARRQGLGRRLLGIAESLAADGGMSRLSLVVADGNEEAVRVYNASGFTEIARRPMHRPEIDSPGRHWLLMVKELSEQTATAT